MGDPKNSGNDKQASQGRREFLKKGTALTGAAALGGALSPLSAQAQSTAKTLVIAAPATPQSLDIEFDVSLGSVDSLGALYDYLVAYEKIPDPQSPTVLREDTSIHAGRPNNMALKGSLAESWDVSKDGRRAVFKLREGVRSNWGNLLSAEDVKWTWDRKFNLKGMGPFLTATLGLKKPDQIKIEGPMAISFNLDEPNPLLLKLQAALNNPIYDAKKCKSAGGATDPWATNFLQNESAGFGPYKVEKIMRGQQAIFKARSDYWGPKPFMDTVIMREVPTSATRLSLLAGGAVDIAQYLQPREYLSLKNNPNATYDAVNSSYMLWLELNAKVAPLDNVKVRRALNFAIPHADVINTIYYGLADKLSAPMPRIYPMATSEFGRYDYNLEMAKKLLAEAGFASGFKTTLSYNAGDPVQEPIALMYQTALRKIGVDLQLEKLPAGVFYEAVTKRQKPIIFYLDSPWVSDPGYSMFLYFHQKSFVNYSNYANAKVNGEIERGLATLDNDVRQKVYRDVQRILMEDAPWGFLTNPKFTLARKKNLKGFTYYTSNNLRFQDFSRA